MKFNLASPLTSQRVWQRSIPSSTLLSSRIPSCVTETCGSRDAMAKSPVDCETEGRRPLKRRKVRKGTQSCWECKRRKVRCTRSFATPNESICDGCRSRRLKCIGQDFHDDAELTRRKVDRLDRVEALVEQLAKRADTDLPGLLTHETPSVSTKIMVSIFYFCVSANA